MPVFIRRMPKRVFFAVLFLVIADASSSHAGFFDSCSIPSMQDKPKPVWVKDGWSKSGYYSGVGRIDKRKDAEEWIKSAEQAAINSAAQQISIDVKSKFRDEMGKGSQDYKQKFEQDISLVVETSVKENLRGLSIADKWLDKDDCVLFALAQIPEESVESTRKFQKILYFYDSAGGLLKNQNKKVALEYLNDALAMLGEVNFKYLPESEGRTHWQTKLEREIERLKGDVGSNAEKTLVFPLRIGQNVEKVIVERVVGAIKTAVRKGERLAGNCDNTGSCLDVAYGQGYSNLALVKIERQITQSPTGAFKGTLRVEATVYDAQKRSVVKGPVEEYGQVVGWTEESLDWKMAADKVLASGRFDVLGDK